LSLTSDLLCLYRLNYMNEKELSGQRQEMLGLENETVNITLMREQLYRCKLPLLADFTYFKITFPT